MDHTAVGRAKGRAAVWVAWSMLAIVVACYAVAIPLAVVNGHAQQLTLLLAFPAFMVVGAAIVSHRPGNAVGWIFAAIGLLAATGGLAMEYAAYAYVTRPGSWPGAVLAVWYQNQIWIPTLTLMLVFTPLLFPTGRLLSARWRPVAVVAASTMTTIVALTALQPTLDVQGEQHTVRNPIGPGWEQNPENTAVGAALLGLLLVCAVAAAVSLVLRFRRSRGVERQQLKWFTYAAALGVLVLVMTEYLPASGVINMLFGLLFALIPVSAGLAILRYRLYEIDRIINRTLVYGLVTAMLAGVYAGVVLILGQLFGAVASPPPSWAVAGATLAVAALFQPARRRIQALVDRRFNRRKYDATKTVEAFTARLREEVDLDTLSAELLAVVDQTVQPTQAWLWLRPSAQGPRR
jgi:hypothetical protein